MTILVDTAAFCALADGSDRHHEAAVGFYESTVGRAALLTTDHVLIESWMIIRKRLGRAAAMSFWDQLARGMIPIIGVGASDLERARQIAHQWGGLSLVDCSSMAVMERMAIGSVFTFDTDFDRFRTSEERPVVRVPES